MKKRPLVAIAILGAAALGACAQRWPENPNVILISIDSLRADRLGVYGHDRETSPNVDRLAGESVVFDHAYSTTTWTLPSHISMLTGLYPEVHGVQQGKQRLSEDAVLCSEVFQELGYKTAGVVSGPYLHRRFGFNQGWDVYDDYTIRFRNTPASHQGVTSPAEHERILEVLDELDQGPFFLFLHYWDVHLDYVPPEPYDRMFDPGYEGDLTGHGFLDNPLIHPEMDPRDLEHLLALYDGEIALTDHYLGRLFEDLKRRGLYRDALIIFTSDHGDEFFEHGGKAHRRNLYNETLQVPMVVKFPRGRWGGKRVSASVSLVDLVPTIFDVVGSEPLATVNGRSLLSLASGEDDGRRRISFADLQEGTKSIIGGSWKLISQLGEPDESSDEPPDELNEPDENFELYDLDADPGETVNLALEQSERVAAMRGSLGEWLTVAERQAASLGKEAIEYDEETRRALEALGYLD